MRRAGHPAPPRGDAEARVGLFGVLGGTNLGNDASMLAVLQRLRARYPTASVDVMGVDPDRLAERYGLPARHVHALRRRVPVGGVAGRVLTAVLVGAGLLADAWAAAAWVRRHDLVIVPGMGALESTLPLRPWQMPWSTFAMTLAGRVLGVRTAFVATGVSVPGSPATRWLLARSARLATHRTYRDLPSRDRARELGVDVRGDRVVHDLVFALPTPAADVRPGEVGVGVMTYSGSAEDRARAVELGAAYRAAVLGLLERLLDEGWRVHLLTSDHDDDPEAVSVLEDLRRRRPGLPPSAVAFEPVEDLAGLMARMAGLELVVGSRFHVVLGALKCGRPTLSVGYGAKHQALMAAMGVAEHQLPAREARTEDLLRAFHRLVEDSEDLVARLRGRAAQASAEARVELDAVLDELMAGLAAPAGPVVLRPPTPAGAGDVEVAS